MVTLPMEERDDAAANITQNEASEQRKMKQKHNNNSSSKDRKRFSDEQIKLLESIFETETKLEPKKKLQVSSELGLQPRQVAIWFQNRRARWKSKMMEQEYRLLRASYDNLESRVELLKIEKESLLLQLQKLSQLLGKPLEGSTTAGSGNNVNIALAVEDNKKINCEPEAQPEVDKRAAAMCTKDERSRDVGSSGDEGRQFDNNYGSDHQCEGGGSLVSFDQRWYGGLDQSGQARLDNLPCTSSSQWFDSWI